MTPSLRQLRLALDEYKRVFEECSKKGMDSDKRTGLLWREDMHLGLCHYFYAQMGIEMDDFMIFLGRLAPKDRGYIGTTPNTLGHKGKNPADGLTIRIETLEKLIKINE